MACRNFVELAKSGYFDGLLVFRVVKGMLCQTGDPNGDGTGGFSIYGPKFPDEITAKLSHDRPGVVSMANYGRNTNCSQFFFTFAPCPHLDGNHTIFGAVCGPDSLATLQAIASTPCKKEKPKPPVRIFSVTVEDDPWEGEPLPEGAVVPEKPLGAEEDSKCVIS